MTLPALFFGVTLSTLYGAVFHLWRGGSGGRLLLYLLMSWIGFWSGHLLAAYLDWSFDKLGQLHLGTATLGSAITLGIGYWLSLVQVEK